MESTTRDYSGNPLSPSSLMIDGTRSAKTKLLGLPLSNFRLDGIISYTNNNYSNWCQILTFIMNFQLVKRKTQRI